MAVHSDEATFDVQFGSLKRKVHKNTSWDKARFEYGGQKWMDFSEGPLRRSPAQRLQIRPLRP